jgi:type IV secretion system protein TrbL
MGGTGVIDRFLEVFTSYIDSGFGLLQGEVAFVATTLIVIDVTLAALFWTFGEGDDIVARLVRKTLFVGVFAYLIGNWNTLARIVFESFAGLGLKASGTGFTTAELLQPGRVAQVGLDAGRPILESISGLMGYISFFENFIQITVLLFAWIVVLLAFFVLAVQLFVTLIEFKLTVLCGFVLIPFGLFGKTAFLAERVLGNVVSSGIKILVLAVIVGIGSTLFSEFTQAIGSAQPTIEDAMAIVLGALCLLGLGIFGPGIASGIVSGGPQLGAGAAAGTALAAGGVVAAGGAALGAAGSALAGSARTVGTAAGAWRAGTEGKSGPAGAGAGGTHVGGAPGTSERSPLRPLSGHGSPEPAGAVDPQPVGEGTSEPAPQDPAAPDTGDGSIARADPGPVEHDGGIAPEEQPVAPVTTPPAAPSDASRDPAAEPATPQRSAPAWARLIRGGRAVVHAAGTATHTLRGGDSRGPGASISLTDKE